MKVFELMRVLADAPANMEVFVTDLGREVPSASIIDTEIDGHDANGMLCLHVRYEEEEKSAAA